MHSLTIKSTSSGHSIAQECPELLAQMSQTLAEASLQIDDGTSGEAVNVIIDGTT